MKTCTKCGASKDPADFYAHLRAKDGLQSNCKACMREASKRRGKALTAAHRAARGVHLLAAPLAPGHKLCSVCGAEKVLEEFYFHLRADNGRAARCRDCAKQAGKRRYKEAVAAHIAQGGQHG